MEEQVLHYLQATLSPQEQVRRNAEEQLEQLFLHPGVFPCQAYILGAHHSF